MALAYDTCATEPEWATDENPLARKLMEGVSTCSSPSLCFDEVFQLLHKNPECRLGVDTGDNAFFLPM
jgi:hypothetical protein